MRIAAAVTCWQDVDSVTETLRSVAGRVDRVYLADGLIAGVPDLGLRDTTDLPAAVTDLADVIVRRGWSSQSVQRQALLDLARGDGCDWLLAIDSDETLEECGWTLRETLDGYPAAAYPLLVLTTDPADHAPRVHPHKLLHIPSWGGYASMGCHLSSRDGRIVTLDGGAATVMDGLWLLHDPGRRRGRRGRLRLSEHEAVIESHPAAAAVWTQPTPPPPCPDGRWCCPCCGRRYPHAAVCAAQHSPTQARPA